MCCQEVVPKKKTPTQTQRLLIPHNWTTDPMHRWFRVDSAGIRDSGLNIFQIMEYTQINILDMMIFNRTSILSREGFILLDLEIIKMIIKPEEVLVKEIREPDINYLYDELVSIFDENVVPRENRCEDIWDADHDSVTPLEFRALDVALGAICSYFNGKAHKLENDIHLALREVTSKITSVNYGRVSCDISQLKTSVEKVRDELVRLMGNEEDMASLYLSRTVDTSSSSNVNKILLMLQSYFTQTRMVGKKLSELLEGIDYKLELIKYQLEHDRTQLIKLKGILNRIRITVWVFIIMFWLWYLLTQIG